MSGRMKLQIRRYGRSFLILIGLIVLGTAAGFYILLQQRLPNPFQSFYQVNAAFPTAAAVVPGLGEPVNVAGVRVGEITGTDLVDGHGVIHMDINPGKIARLYKDASAVLVPNTPLKDMEVDIAPGSRTAGVLPDGATIPVSQTTSPTDSDELLDALDTDTRTWFTSLITDLNEGTLGRGNDIRKLLGNLGPTSQQLSQIGNLLAARHTELSAIVHNLGVLTQAAAVKDAQLRQVVLAGNTTVQALATQDVALRAAITKLPGTLATTDKTLTDLIPFANALGPTATALLPTARKLPTTLRDARTLFEGAALLPLKEIPPFIKVVLPLASQLPALTTDLNQAVPALIKSFKVLAYVTNEIAYDPGGRNPGFLYWLAWFAHNADSFISQSDANGPVWRVLTQVSCSSLQTFPAGQLLESLVLTNFGC
ncbi:MAG TPA: MlaD family protein [Solirubrobacteraceae bacterium]|nr:MlaD family protein [Solirubrobacteraceae bacterium]